MTKKHYRAKRYDIEPRGSSGEKRELQQKKLFFSKSAGAPSAPDSVKMSDEKK